MPDLPGAAGAALTPARKILSVTELTRQVKTTLEGGFAAIWLTGEVSNLRTPASGHVYLTLKDAEAQIRAVIWGSTARYLSERPQDGQQILCRARITVYEPRGEYQVVIDYLETAGIGLLYRQIEATRTQLSAEGLFDPEGKQSLPPLPKRVAVVTSPTGAALRDILQVLARRAPGLSVLVVPAPVQGAGAPAALVAALTELSRDRWDGEIDAVILARGGGSLEDLMAFNDEQVVRAVAACPLPVVCGVGHETDTTLVDHAADLRAPTPSAAAELVSSAWGDWQRRNNELFLRLQRATHTRIQGETLKTHAIQRGLIDPGERLRHMLQRLDDLNGRLTQAIATRLNHAKHRYQATDQRLTGATPAGSIPMLRERNRALAHRVTRAMSRRLETATSALTEKAGQLHELSPLAVLNRGYAIARKGTSVVRHSADVGVGDELLIDLHKGHLTCRVTSRSAARKKAP